MYNNIDANRAIIFPHESAAVCIMQRTPVETMKSILSRIGLEYMDGLPREVYLTAFFDEFYGDSSWILKMLPEALLHYLIEIWENESVDVSGEHWEELQYLNVFGFLTFAKGDPMLSEPNVIRYTKDMKENFYFHLKSRKSRKIMEKYTEWEQVLTGLLYYYGLIELTDLHICFCRVMKTEVLWEEFKTFLKARCTLWPFGVFLTDQRNQKEYFQYVNVENPEYILMYQKEHEDLMYKYPEKEDLIYISGAAGVDNRWSGVSELVKIFLDEMGMDYYQTTVLIKTLAGMIQNSAEYESLLEKAEAIHFQSEEQKEEAIEAITRLFKTVPLYELKGFSRNEYQKMFSQKQLKKRREMFTIIKGGKDRL